MADDEPPADLSKADLWERLRALEQRVYPDRRDVLKLAGGAVAGGAVGAAATGNASAGSAEAGQLGSAQYPQDAWVEDLYDKNDNHVAELPGDGSFNIDEGTIGDESISAPRPGTELVTNESVTVSVPADYSTVQAAVDDVMPLLRRHTVDIQLDPDQGPYNEDVTVGASLPGDLRDSTDGLVAPLRIRTDPNKSGDATIGTL